jgi:hypothetical protein
MSSVGEGERNYRERVFEMYIVRVRWWVRKVDGSSGILETYVVVDLLDGILGSEGLRGFGL